MIELTDVAANRIANRLIELKTLRKEQYAEKLAETNTKSEVLDLIIALENEMFSIDADIKRLKP
jgi:hypothetical protein